MQYLHLVLLSLLTVFLVPLSQAQQFTISGHVRDAETGEEILGANVYIPYLEVGAATGFEGEYSFKVEAGTHILMVKYIGFETIEREIQVLRDFVIDFELENSANRFPICPIYDNRPLPSNQMALASARSFRVDDIARMPAALSDPARLALSYAGIKGSDDITGALSIRGNSPKGVVWRIEGIEITTPSHFSTEGGVTGSVSMLSSNFLGSSDIYTGAFPAEIGNAIGGAFDLKLRNGLSDKAHFHFELGLLGAQAGMEGPLNKADKYGRVHTYNLNYRYSTLGLVGDLGFNIGNTITGYQDLNFKTHFHLNDKSYLDLFVIGGKSEVSRNELLIEKKTYELWVGGLSYINILNEYQYIKLGAAYSFSEEIYSADLIAPSSDNWFYESVDNAVRITAAHQYNKGRLLIKTGINYSLHDFESMEAIDDVNPLPTPRWEADDQAGLGEVYSQVKYILGKTELTAGLRGNLFFYNENWNIEPRLAIRHTINNATIYAAAGLHSSLESMGFYMTQYVDSGSTTQLNKGIDFTKASHLVAGVSAGVGVFNLKGEVYYQNLYAVPVALDRNSLFSSINYMWRYPTELLTNNGEGLNYGIELTMERYYAQNWFSMLSVSGFRSFFTAADGLRRSSAWDSGFILNAAGGKRFNLPKEKDHLMCSGRVLFSGGYRLEETDFTTALSNYFRGDIRFAYVRSRSKNEMTVAVDVQNFTNRLNENITDDIDPVGLIPVLTLGVDF